MENSISSKKNFVQEESRENPAVRSNTTKKKWIFGVIGLIAISFFIFMVVFAFGTPSKTISKTLTQTKKVLFVPLNTPTPSPLPFAELTIPYLREKKYESKIGSLEEDYGGSNYIAYLTSYKSDGLKINALLTKPVGEMPEGGWPAIVFIHGYIPPTQYQTDGQAYSSYVDYLASSGFVVFKIDLRGHGNSEGRPGGGYYGADYVTDALNARVALQTTDFVNPDKIGMWGHSMAGNTLMRSVAVKPDIPAVAIWAGAVYTYIDQRKYGISDGSYRPPQIASAQQNNRRLLYEKVGSPSAKSVFWQQMAATSYLDDLKGAIEIHHAVDDDVVNVGYSRDLMALLDKTSVPHELYEYEYGGHNITGGSFNLAMERTVEFFKKHLSR